jgi:hypothetical protein
MNGTGIVKRKHGKHVQHARDAGLAFPVQSAGIEFLARF